MMNPFTQLDQLVAAGRVNGATLSPDDGSNVANGGFREGLLASSLRTGLGAYTLLLKGGGVDPLQSLPSAILEGTGAAAEDIRCNQTDDVTFLITTFAAGVAADRSFKFSVRRVKAPTP